METSGGEMPVSMKSRWAKYRDRAAERGALGLDAIDPTRAGFVPLEEHTIPQMEDPAAYLRDLASRLHPGDPRWAWWTALATACEVRGVRRYGVAFERLALELERRGPA